MESKKIIVENFENEVNLVKSNEVYNLYDLELDHLTVGMTVLHAGKQTRGHAHDNVEEIYHFLKGKGKMIVGEDEIDVKEGDLVTIPIGDFHRVINDSEEDFKFLAIFEKYKRE